MMKLRVYPDSMAVQSRESEASWLSLARDVSTGRDAASTAPLSMTLTTTADLDSLNPPPLTVVDIHAVVGVFRLLAGPYLCVVTDSTPAASGPGPASFQRIDGVRLLPFSPSSDGILSAAQRSDEEKFIKMVLSIFKTKSMFYGTNYEVTHTAQRIYEFMQTDGEGASASTWTRADDRFLWNQHLLTDFQHARGSLPQVDNWVTPIMNGFIGYHTNVSLGGDVTADLLLISRRSRHRQGTRFNRRGIDVSGDVANFVETEQILMHSDGRISSFVQVRGSIPVYWSQDPTMKYTPKCILNPAFTEEQTHLACTTHMRSLNTMYDGAVTAVNLIDTKKDQDMLGKAFEAAAGKANTKGASVDFVWFDFHKECSKMRYDRLSLLMDRVDKSLNAVGIFQTNSAGTAVSVQKGVFRTNCMDNLDRTNVVQSLFGRWAVRAALRSTPGAGPTSSNVLDTDLAAFERQFKAMWADNADAMSMLYSGTGALKTDFTRTGKRTIAGALQDGVNSMTRYVINNLVDGRRQDAWDLFLGRYNPAALGARGYDVSKSPLRASSQDTTPGRLCLGLVLLNVLVMAGTVAVMTTSGSSSSLTSQLVTGGTLASVLFGAVSYLTVKRGVGPGKALVSKPHMTIANDVARDSPSP